MNTNTIESAFWQLLRAGLWQEARFLQPHPQLSDSQWQELYALALRTGTVGLIAEGLELLPQRPPEAVVLLFVSQRGELTRRHLRHNQAIASLMRTLRSLSVDSLLLKGQGCAHQYANPYCRSCGDIDIYIGPERIDSLLVELEKMGITCEEEIDDNGKHAHFYYRDLTFELHRHSAHLDSRRADRLYQQWWAAGMAEVETLYATPSGQLLPQPAEDAEPVHLPSPERNAFFLFFHAFHHLCSMGVQFRQFCDVARYLYTHNELINREILEEKLRTFGLLRPWQLVMAYLHQYLGLEERYIPCFDPSLSPQPLYRRLRRKCLYPRRPLIPRPKGRTASKLYSLEQHIEAFFGTLRLFPGLAIRQLAGRIVGGAVNYFNRANRTGTLEHYRERTAEQNKSPLT